MTFNMTYGHCMYFISTKINRVSLKRYEIFEQIAISYTCMVFRVGMILLF